jgi:antirestriction protein ArdC
MTQTSSRSDIYTRITDKIVADLEQGTRPWLRPWSVDHAEGRITRPLRFNGIPYNGINAIMLWSAAVAKGYSCPHWLTFKQALDLGGGRVPWRGVEAVDKSPAGATATSLA